MSPSKLAAVLCAVAITMAAAPAMALTFATERSDPTPRSPSDLLLPGLTNVYSDSGANDTDALSFGRSAALVPPLQPGSPALPYGVQLYFSVDPLSLGATVGTPTAVQVEATPPTGGPPAILLDQSADVYLTSMGQIGNSHYSDGDGLSPPGAGAGPGPTLGLIEPGVPPYIPPPPGTPPGDVNALDMRNRATFMGQDTFFYSVVAGDPAAAPLPPSGVPASGANIFITTFNMGTGYHAQRQLYASEAQLGLQPGDDIDGLVVFEDGDSVFNPANDYVFYSLAPGSTTLGMTDPQFGLGITAGDLLWTGNPLGLVTISNPAEVFGLLTVRGGAQQNDNMNALDIILEDDNGGGPIVPEPSSFLLAALGLLSLGYLGWQRK